MNKILFGVIGLLFLGVIGTGIVAIHPATDASIAAKETQTIPDPIDISEDGTVPDSSGKPSITPSPDPKPTPQPTPHPVPTPTPTPQPGVYTMAQVAIHNSEASCYTAIEGSVYDVTPFIRQHPGGTRAILSLCGKDGTRAFESQHGGERRPAAELASFKIGRLSA